MRYVMPMILCDNTDCGSGSPDYYEMTASEVDGVPVTGLSRAPGWSTTPVLDLCPDCLKGTP